MEESPQSFDLSAAIDEILGDAPPPMPQPTAELSIIPIPISPSTSIGRPVFTTPQQRLVDEIQDEYLESHTSRDILKTALAHDASAKAQKFLSELLNPRNSKLKLSRIARKVGVDSQDIERIVRSHSLSTALTTYVTAAPAIAGDVVEDSRSFDDICPRCDGLGQFKPTEKSKLKTCPRCKGKGEIRVPGNSDARRLVYDRIDPRAKSGGLNLNINMQGGTGSPLSTGSVIDEMEQFAPSNQAVIDIKDFTSE